MTAGGKPVAGSEVLVVGPAYCDLVFAGLAALPELGTERFAGGFLVAAGGSAITAIALRRLGRRVGLLADVGTDPHGEVVRAALRAEGVETAWLRTGPGATTPVTAVLSTPADRAFATWLPPAGPPPDLAAALEASSARHLHVAGFPAALALREPVTTAHAHGATVSFDPGWDAEALGDPRVQRLAHDSDVLLPNRREALALAGLADTSEDDADAAARALRRLAAARPSTVTVVKDGPRGALGADPHERASVPSPAVEAVDPTGAGDVFDAGFLDAWLEGAPLADCLRRGVACGARAVTAHGGASAAPTRDQLERAAAVNGATPREEGSS